MNKAVSFIIIYILFACQILAAGNSYDIVVYGGSCSGITAAIQAKRMGKEVILVCPEKHLGGLTISGLGWTDTKDVNCIGGLSREFYHRIWQYYKDPGVWEYQSRDSYNVNWQAGPGIQDSSETMWTFEPHVAEEVFEQWLQEENITVVRNRWLDRSSCGVVKDGNNITAIKTLSYDDDFGFSEAETITGKMFIDTSYEGDLMAAASASYRIGRDDNSEYNETLNGIYFKSSDLSLEKSPYKNIDPYNIPGDPSSGLIRQIEGEFDNLSQIGKADGRLQAFNFRMCMTDVSSNRVPIEKPLAYDEKDYELLFRLYEAGQNPGFTDQRMPNLKTDNNNSGLMSLDWPGGNHSMANNWIYSEASYTERMNYVKRQRDYQRGLLWTMLYHPRVPAASRSSRVKWGLPKDEFADNGHWPYFSYVREARRLEGEMVMTEHHVKMKDGYAVSDSIGQGSYSLDSHVVRRVVIDGAIWDEGGFYVWWSKGYPISYKSIVPQRKQANNLLVPVCLSASHAAFGSIRMEPTYMILGQSAATAAALAIDYQYDVQDVPYALLRTRLLKDGQRLKETFEANGASVLLNFGTRINDNDNSPAHEIGKVSGVNWNLVTSDVASGIVTATGRSTYIAIDLGKSLPGADSIDWDRHGFVNSSLGADYSTGLYSGNARSAVFVDDGKNSDVKLGVKISGLNSGVYGIYLTANNTNTEVSDSYKVYAFENEPSITDTDFAARGSSEIVNNKGIDTWTFDSNFIAPVVSLNSGKDLVVVVEGLASADYRAFLNTLEIVQLTASPYAPVIIAEPQSVQVDSSGDDSNDDVSIACSFKSTISPIVSWYRLFDDGYELLNDSQDESFVISEIEYNEDSNVFFSTLTINNISKDYAGKYCCVVENNEGMVISQQAEIVVSELLAHWTFDQEMYANNSYIDQSIYGRDVTVSGSAQFVNGADSSLNGAINLSSVSGSGVISSWNPLDDTGEFSIACWVNWTGGSETSIIIDKSDSWDSAEMMWTWGINPATNRINFVSAGSTEFQTQIDTTEFKRNQWHHLVVTYNDDTNIAQLYIDAVLVNTGLVVLGTKTDSIMHLGVDSGSRYFNGMLDDMRIYNSVLDQNGILEAYNGAALNKKNICNVDDYSSMFDLSGPDNVADCIIDGYDLAAMVDSWLSSGSYPQ